MAGLALLAVPGPGFAQPKPKGAASSPLGGLGGDSKEPIKIDADKLDVLDKENKAVFTGNVVAVQGDTTVRCTVMTVLYEGRNGGQGGQKGQAATPAPAAKPAAPATPSSNDSSIKRILCKGPVTVVSKTQAATSDNAVFDRANNKVIMTGNVALNDGPNITRGERLVYDTQTGIANVDTKPGGRVQGFFVPNSAEAGKEKPGAAAKPATPTN
ncbi:MAG: organic solvent tolerance protein OstA [Bosea sp.]|nr:organic solvent tolerance protein OstA [Bosea sp. (in: a-proteobacteria)]